MTTSSWQKKIQASIDHVYWRSLAHKLDESLDDSIKHPRLIDKYYLPLFLYLFNESRAAGHSPFVIGINAPQGGGKSTLSGYMVRLFDWCDLKAVTLSIDDFYLTRQDQVRIATDKPDNIYLQQRGYPGTHDIDLGVRILSRLKNPGNGQRLSLPRYNKSKHRGQGDREDKSLWPEIQLPVDIVLVEGWMLGFQPLPSSLVPDSHLSEVNRLLEKYHQWHRFLDSFIYLYPEDPIYVVDWRSEAEERMKEQGLPGMSPGEVRAYAEKFLPAYRLYGPRLLEDPPVSGSFLKIKIGKNRLPVD